MSKGGKRLNAGRKNKGLKQDTVYIAVSTSVRDQLKTLAKTNETTLKDYIKHLINGLKS